MSDEPMNPETLQEMIVAPLEQNGHLNVLRARILTLIAKEIRDSEIPELSVHKNVQKGLAHEVTQQVVIQYLERMGLNLVYECANYETLMRKYQTIESVASELGVDKKGLWIRDLIKLHNDDMKRAMFDATRREIETALKNLSIE